MRFEKVNINKYLSSINKPSRYINHEIHSYHKQPSENLVNFCLVFPEVYEIGMSHLGIKILYTILNNEKDSCADRCYAPWPDLAEILKEKNIPLFGVESKAALKDFDVLGVTVQSEVTYTNILYVLDLAQIPLLSRDRQENDPIVLGGGPCVSNPEPIADFFDVFLIGEAEEAIIEIKNTLKEFKNMSRRQKLLELSKIEGVYVPSLLNFSELSIEKQQEKIGAIKIRKYTKFSDMESYHNNQLIPWQQATHDRYVAEIMRGCSRNCRFCHAGIFYRPVRERNPEKLIKQLVKEVSENGWDEAALTSLSSSDYTLIKPLLLELYKQLSNSGAKLSLPSLRVDSLDQELVALMNSIRQTGLTIAPEAGSQRMRNVINKNITEEEILEGVKIALNNGWQLIKLYFMIGLPYETKADINEIITLIDEIILLSKKKLRINITISPFVPKSITPFQWTGMQSRDYLLENAKHIKQAFRKFKFIKIKYHTIEQSMLECILTRGDRKVGNLILNTYSNGAKFDGWDEYFNFERWQKAAEEENIDLSSYLSPKNPNKNLPWDFINPGVTKDYLLSEWKKSETEELTADCRTGDCYFCGVCDDKITPQYQKEIPDIDFTPVDKIVEYPNVYHYRFFYSKTGDLQFVAHLDTLRMIHRIARAIKLPLVYSQGYNPHPKIALGPPLSIGVQGENEYFDIALYEYCETDELYELMSKAIPSPMQLHKVIPLVNKEMRDMNYFKFEVVEVTPDEGFHQEIEKKLEDYNSNDEIIFERVRKGKIRTANLKEIVEEINWENNKLLIKKKLIGANVFDILRVVFGINREDTGSFNIIRKKLVRS